jgi:hypothetical protein
MCPTPCRASTTTRPTACASRSAPLGLPSSTRGEYTARFIVVRKGMLNHTFTDVRAGTSHDQQLGICRLQRVSSGPKGWCGERFVGVRKSPAVREVPVTEALT